MNRSLIDYIILSILNAKKFNRSQVSAPKVILWPDPEQQWISVLDILRKEIDAFITLGTYDPENLQGPSIWIKCLVDHTLPEANWEQDVIPVIFLPGVAKADFKNIEEAPASIQPLMEYQFKGNLWTQENGKEWTVLSFLQNVEQGMGLDVARDEATKEAVIKSLPNYIEDGEVLYHKKIDADFLNQLMFPQVIPTLLSWMEVGDKAISSFPLDQQEAFKDVIKSQYHLDLDYSMVIEFVQRMGKQRDPWHQVWQYFANAPHKFPKILEYLDTAQPADMGTGMFKVPDESWPKINQEHEEELKKSILKLLKLTPQEAISKLKDLYAEHKERLNWIWSELGRSPFAEALPHLILLSEFSIKVYDNSSIESIKKYYQKEGIKIDNELRKLYLIDHSKEYLKAIQMIIDKYYTPWLEKLTIQFQSLVSINHNFLYSREILDHESKFILFVDAFRYDIAQEFIQNHISSQYEVSIDAGWSAVPSLTPTSKPSVAPIRDSLNHAADWNSFQAQLKNGKTLSQYYFKSALAENEFLFIDTPSEIDDPNNKYWMEIGDIDKKGHQEQERMLRRIPELMKELKETIKAIFDKGIPTIQIVTDHGWLLLPGGLPKASLHKDLVETRWGRCALIKEGVKTDLLHLPWTWNPHTFIAYAPGISFFKKNESYAHGGISLHECLTPFISIKATHNTKSEKSSIQSVSCRGMRLYVNTIGANDTFKVDIRMKTSDPKTSIVLKSTLKEDNVWNLLVNGDYEEHSATLILINDQGIIVDKKPIHIGS